MTHNLPDLYKQLGPYGKLAKKLVAEASRESILALADLCEEYLPVASSEFVREKDLRAWRMIAELSTMLKRCWEIKDSGHLNDLIYRDSQLFPVYVGDLLIAELCFSMTLRPGHALIRSRHASILDDHQRMDWIDYINFRRLKNARRRLDIARSIESSMAIYVARYQGYLASKASTV